MQLTQKEISLLMDLKEQEQICIEKYSKYTIDANDQQLKDLFTQLGSIEQQHFDTINQIISGTVPAMQSGNDNQMQQTFTPTYTSSDTSQERQMDNFLCSDVLSTEKHVSSTYNTSIFEFRDTNIRDILNHIQKEEQQHGEQIYNYMAQNGMYN